MLIKPINTSAQNLSEIPNYGRDDVFLLEGQPAPYDLVGVDPKRHSHYLTGLEQRDHLDDKLKLCQRKSACDSFLGLGGTGDFFFGAVVGAGVAGLVYTAISIMGRK